MKYKNILYGILTSFCLGLVASCATGIGNNKNIQDVDAYKDVITHVDQNLVEIEKEETTTDTAFRHANFQNLDGYTVVNDRYASIGLLVVKNNIGRVGFYSLLVNDFIHKCEFLESGTDFTYKVKRTEIGYCIALTNDGRSTIIDNFGNNLINNVRYSWEIETVMNNGTMPVLKLVHDNSEDYFRYVGNEAIRTHYMPDNNTHDDDEAPSENVTFVGDLFKNDRIELGEFNGRECYLLISKDGILTIFDKNTNKSISTFYVPKYSRPLLIGSKLIYQEISELPEKTINYAFVMDGKPYSLTTKCLDIQTNEEKTLDLPYVIKGNSRAFKDDSGSFTRALIDMQMINGSKGLEPTKTYLISQDLTVIGDYSGMEIDSFIKTKNGYYNLKTCMLYDNQMRLLEDFEGKDVEYLDTKDVFRVTSFTGKSNLYTSSGKKVFAKDVKELYVNNKDEYVIALEKDSYKRYLFSNLVSGSTKGNELKVIDKNNLLFADISSTPTLVNLTGDISGTNNFVSNFDNFKLINYHASNLLNTPNTSFLTYLDGGQYRTLTLSQSPIMESADTSTEISLNSLDSFTTLEDFTSFYSEESFKQVRVSLEEGYYSYSSSDSMRFEVLDTETNAYTYVEPIRRNSRNYIYIDEYSQYICTMKLNEYSSSQSFDLRYEGTAPVHEIYYNNSSYFTITDSRFEYSRTSTYSSSDYITYTFVTDGQFNIRLYYQLDNYTSLSIVFNGETLETFNNTYTDYITTEKTFEVKNGDVLRFDFYIQRDASGYGETHGISCTGTLF